MIKFRYFIETFNRILTIRFLRSIKFLIIFTRCFSQAVLGTWRHRQQMDDHEEIMVYLIGKN